MLVLGDDFHESAAMVGDNTFGRDDELIRSGFFLLAPKKKEKKKKKNATYVNIGTQQAVVKTETVVWLVGKFDVPLYCVLVAGA